MIGTSSDDANAIYASANVFTYFLFQGDSQFLVGQVCCLVVVRRVLSVLLPAQATITRVMHKSSFELLTSKIL